MGTRDPMSSFQERNINDYLLLQQQSCEYGGEKLKVPVLVDPEILGNMKKTVFIYHDESTVHAKERAAKTWLLPGTS
jgi:hypothetical protein